MSLSSPLIVPRTVRAQKRDDGALSSRARSLLSRTLIWRVILFMSLYGKHSLIVLKPSMCCIKGSYRGKFLSLCCSWV